MKSTRSTCQVSDRRTGGTKKAVPEQIQVDVNVEMVLRDPDGAVVDRRVIHNTITTSGLNGIVDQLLASPTLAKPTHMANGTGTPGANALGAEIDRNALTSKTRAGNVLTMVAFWAAGDSTGALTEQGIFDAASGGNMWMSDSFAVLNKLATMSLETTWTLTIS